MWECCTGPEKRALFRCPSLELIERIKRLHLEMVIPARRTDHELPRSIWRGVLHYGMAPLVSASLQCKEAARSPITRTQETYLVESPRLTAAFGPRMSQRGHAAASHHCLPRRSKQDLR